MRIPPLTFGSKYGALDILSIPPATITLCEPERILSQANIIDFIPEPHILFIVVAPICDGIPAPRVA